MGWREEIHVIMYVCRYFFGRFRFNLDIKLGYVMTRFDTTSSVCYMLVKYTSEYGKLGLLCLVSLLQNKDALVRWLWSKIY